MARDYFVLGGQVAEEAEREYFVLGRLVNEDQAAAASRTTHNTDPYHHGVNYGTSFWMPSGFGS